MILRGDSDVHYFAWWCLCPWLQSWDIFCWWWCTLVLVMLLGDVDNTQCSLYYLSALWGYGGHLSLLQRSLNDWGQFFPVHWCKSPGQCLRQLLFLLCCFYVILYISCFSMCFNTCYTTQIAHLSQKINWLEKCFSFICLFNLLNK